MKKMARLACLVAALVLPGVATADSWLYGTCYNSCGGTTWTEYGSCCGTQYQCPDGSTGYATWWEGMYGGGEACII